jgi:hypothetical protein
MSRRSVVKRAKIKRGRILSSNTWLSTFELTWRKGKPASITLDEKYQEMRDPVVTMSINGIVNTDYWELRTPSILTETTMKDKP